MCDPSVVSDDWVTKGCHIHIGGVELKVISNHHGKIVFKGFFAATTEAEFNWAREIAFEECLPSSDIRQKWLKRLESARVFMNDFRSSNIKLENKANGRMLEFKFLRFAILYWERENGFA